MEYDVISFIKINIDPKVRVYDVIFIKYIDHKVMEYDMVSFIE